MHDVGDHVQTAAIGGSGGRGRVADDVGVEGAIDIDTEPGLTVHPRGPDLAGAVRLLRNTHDLEQAGDVGLGPAKRRLSGGERDDEVLVGGIAAGLAGLGRADR